MRGPWRAGARAPRTDPRKGKDGGEMFSTSTLFVWCIVSMFLIHKYVVVKPNGAADGVEIVAAAGTSSGGNSLDARSLGELALAQQAQIAKIAVSEPAPAAEPEEQQEEEEEQEEEEKEEEEQQQDEEQEEQQSEASTSEGDSGAGAAASADTSAASAPSPPSSNSGSGSNADGGFIKPGPDGKYDVSGPLWTWDDHPKRYLMLVQGQEGFG